MNRKAVQVRKARSVRYGGRRIIRTVEDSGVLILGAGRLAFGPETKSDQKRGISVVRAKLSGAGKRSRITVRINAKPVKLTRTLKYSAPFTGRQRFHPGRFLHTILRTEANVGSKLTVSPYRSTGVAVLFAGTTNRRRTKVGAEMLLDFDRELTKRLEKQKAKAAITATRLQR